ncbi:MAG: S-layer protein [Eubacterium sp.]|nr:S-layer protein [Eubacterium sp.]
MKKRIVTFINVLLALSLVFTQLTYANSGTVDNSSADKQASNLIFDWKTDDKHLSGDYNSVVYGKGVYVAVGNKGIISVSKDLKKWDAIYLADYNFGPMPEDGFKTVLFNGDVFVAAGGQALTYSKDGYHWNRVNIDNNSLKPDRFTLSYDALINYGMTKGKTFILTGSGVLAYSVDGVNWRNQPGISIEHVSMFTIGSIFTNPIFDGNQFVAVCTNWMDENFNKKHSVYTSKDGLSWEETETGDLKSYSYDFLSYFEGKYYTSYFNYNTYKNGVIESQDLISWKDSEVRADNTCYNIDDVTYKLGDGIYSYKKDAGFAAEYKVNGTPNDTVPGDATRLNGLCKGDGKLVAVGTDGLVLVCSTADKGIWTQPENQSFKSIYSAAAGKDCIVAVGKAGQIIKSKDGQNWSNLKTNITQSLYSVIYDGKKFVAVGDKGTITVSVNGDTWEVVPQKNEEDLTSIQKINNIYFAVGRHVILTSRDAKKWSVVLGEDNDKQYSAEPLSNIAWKDGVYYTISSSNSFVYSSKDGVKWEQSSRLKGSYYSDLCFYKGRFVLVGGGAAISKDMKSEIKLKEGYMDFDSNLIKINVFKDFLLSGMPNGDIYYSPDGIIWSKAGQIDSNDCANAFIEFKGKYYGFTTNGVIITGTLKGKIPKDSDIIANYLYNYTDKVVDSSGLVTLQKQPIFENNIILLTPETISKIIRGNYSFDKGKKTVKISVGKKNIVFKLNSSYAEVNGKKTKVDIKPQISGNAVFIPAKSAFNSLGYLSSYDSFTRRIYVTIDDKPINNTVSIKPVKIEPNDGNLDFNSVCYNKKVFVAASYDGTICSSKDGVNWTRAAAFKDTWFKKILWNGKRFILFGSTAINQDINIEKGLIYVSEDGVKWTQIENVPASKYLCDGVVGAKGSNAGEIYTGSSLKQTVLIASDGTIITSNDGLVWKKSSEFKVSNWSYVCWYKGTYYVSGRDDGKVSTSKDGSNWIPYNTKIRINRFFSSGDYLWAVNTYKDLRIDSSKLYRSDNGKDWSYINDMPNQNIDDIVFNGSNYLLIGHKFVSYSSKDPLGFIMVSKDGNLWDYTTVPNNMTGVNATLRYGNSSILATGVGLFILTEK